MITAAKLHIYKRFNGDVDMWVRTGSRKEKASMTDQDWAEIDDLLLRLTLAKSGLAAEQYMIETKRLLAERVQDADVIKSLKKCV